MQGRLAWLAVVVAVLAIAAGNGMSAPKTPARAEASHSTARHTAARRRESARLLRAIAARRRETWRWQRVMGRGRTPASDSARHVSSLAYRRWTLRLWTRRARAARRQAARPPHLGAWLCIHRFEGAWSDPNPPYWGGLQMDLRFQQMYGPELLRRKGTADHWSPLEQIWAAEKAYESGRGFYPWPNTARFCGLI
jgi:hypothetical protein